MPEATRVAVIGVGNAFRRDDGVGWAAIELLTERAQARPLPLPTSLTPCDGDPGRLIDLWHGAALAILIDAAHTRCPRPGTVHRLTPDRWSTDIAATSSHGLGVREAIALARVLGRTPGHLVVFAVEAADTRPGPGLSPPVTASLGPLTHEVEAEIARFRVSSAPGHRPPSAPGGSNP